MLGNGFDLDLKNLFIGRSPLLILRLLGFAGAAEPSAARPAVRANWGDVYGEHPLSVACHGLPT